MYNKKYNNNNNFNKILKLFNEIREWDWNNYNFILDMYRNLIIIGEDYWEDIFDIYYEIKEF